MKRTIAMLTAGLVLLLAPGLVSAGSPEDSTQYLESVLVESADTPAEHEALARYYRMKAADAKSLAAEHRSMGKRYHARPSGKRGGMQRQNMKQHCDRIADLNEQLASEYEALAKGEDAAAKE